MIDIGFLLMSIVDTVLLMSRRNPLYFKDFVFYDANYEVLKSALFEQCRHETIIRIHPGSYWLVLK